MRVRRPRYRCWECQRPASAMSTQGDRLCDEHLTARAIERDDEQRKRFREKARLKELGIDSWGITLPPPSIIAAETTEEPAGTPHVDEMPDRPYLYHYAIVVLRPDQLALIATAVADELERRRG